MTDLLPVSEAQSRILANFEPVSSIQIPLGEASRRVLSNDIHAGRDLPGFTSSSMDGFAVLAEDTRGASPDHPVDLSVVADIPAGSPDWITLQPGQAARIMTGAALPDGADAVVPIEQTSVGTRNQGPLPAAVAIFHQAKAGDYLRLRGQDVRQGTKLLSRGRPLRPQDIGLLAMLGIDQVPVYRQPRVALLSSGDELVKPGQPLAPGQIYDANSFLLGALAIQAGADVLALGVVRDDPLLIRERFENAVRLNADLILTSAGVSVGAFDYVRAILEQNGTLNFWRVNMRPGKPLAFGVYQDIPVIGLPGNPVSAYVGFLIFAIPAIRKLAGLAEAQPPRLKAVLDEPVESDGRESYLRAVAGEEDGRMHVRLAGNQSSGNLYTLVQANALLIVPSGVKSLPIGAEVDLLLLDVAFK